MPANGHGVVEPSTSERAGRADSRWQPTGSPRPTDEDRSSSVVTDAVAVVDALFDYLLSRVRLEGRRVECKSRALLGRALVLAAAGAMALLGFVFVSIGAVSMVSTGLGAQWAGPLIVGGLYLVAGVVAVRMGGRTQSVP